MKKSKIKNLTLKVEILEVGIVLVLVKEIKDSQNPQETQEDLLQEEAVMDQNLQGVMVLGGAALQVNQEAILEARAEATEKDES